MIDRRVLWSRLAKHFKVPSSTIRRLQDLFDRNFSKLVIKGSKSKGFENLRGLLQGSSLSPILFNLFIDEMLFRLSQHGPKFQTLRNLTTNTLAFADDVALHSSSKDGMISLLKICESWAIKVGMQFAAIKCYLLGKEQIQEFKLYDITLPCAPCLKYLGIPFTEDGMDLLANAMERSEKARKVTNLVNAYG